MGTLFYIIAAILKTHPPEVNATSPAPASRAMAGLLYIYVCFYSWGWGPLPWVYVSDIFPTRTRHYGLATASASQWLWSKSCSEIIPCKIPLTWISADFVVAKVTPLMISNLGYKIFIMFATINIGVMAAFS